MKFFKSLLLWIMNIISIPLTVLTSLGVAWYILPLGQGLQVYDFINKYTTPQLRF